jgi:predicted DNA-binding antitoxin AbrB/MazE fold protein
MTIRAIYQHGILKLSKKLKLKEHQPVLVDIRLLSEDLPARSLASLAQKSKSLRFLAALAEDIYSRKDGKPVTH